MRLFQVTEYVKYGMRISRGEEPRIPLPPACPMDIRLHPRVIEAIERVNPPPEVQLVAKHMSFQLAANNLMILKPPMPDEDDDDKALVHIATAGGVGGKAYLTANVLREAEDHRGRVSKRPSEFPSLGVQPFCTEEELARVRDGVEILDIVLLMKPGANFCVRRTGGLEGAPPVLSVRWNGKRLSIDNPEKTSHSDARHARAVPTEAFAG
jgi:hypothetical protein